MAMCFLLLTLISFGVGSLLLSLITPVPARGQAQKGRIIGRELLAVDLNRVLLTP